MSFDGETVEVNRLWDVDFLTVEMTWVREASAHFNSTQCGFENRVPQSSHLGIQWFFSSVVLPFKIGYLFPSGNLT